MCSGPTGRRATTLSIGEGAEAEEIEVTPEMVEADGWDMTGLDGHPVEMTNEMGQAALAALWASGLCETDSPSQLGAICGVVIAALRVAPYPAHRGQQTAIRHRFADAMAQKPGTLICDVQGPHELVAAHPLLGRG